MRLIDADALMPKFKCILEGENLIYAHGGWGFTAKCIHAIEDAPTIEPEQKWIPCSERLPEPGEYYLVTRQYSGEYREIDVAKYDFDGWHKADTVLAWCEMPEPYKEVEE